MSALDGWMDILRTGSWRDMRGTEATFSGGDLDAIVAATRAADPAPVVVGHPAADAPAYAWVQDVRRVGDRLQARLRDIDGAFRSAVEAGRYTGRSVALVAGAEGALRIRHLGFLGGRAPAVDGLAPTQFAGAGDAVRTYTFAADEMQRSVFRSIASMFRSMREWIIERDGAEQADRIVPDWNLGIIEDAGREDIAAFAVASDTQDHTVDGSSQHPASPDTAGRETHVAGGIHSADTEPSGDSDMSGTKGAGTGATDLDLAARAAALDAREAVLDAQAAVAPHVEAGRVLPAERAGLTALLASLPADDAEGATLVFAGAEDGAEERQPPRKWLLSFVAALPSRVDYHERAAVDTAPAADGEYDQQSVEAQARAAREFIALAAERGEHVTVTEAVDIVRAGRHRQGGQ